MIKYVFAGFLTLLMFGVTGNVQAQSRKTTEKQQETRTGISLFKKKSSDDVSARSKDDELKDLKNTHKNAKSTVRISKKERKAAEARERAARARAIAIQAEKRAVKADRKADKVEDKATKAKLRRKTFPVSRKGNE